MDEKQATEPSEHDETNSTEAATLAFDERFVLGHPYLQTQWGDLKNRKKSYITNSIVQGVAIAGLCLMVFRLHVPYIFIYYLVPLLGLSYLTFKYIRWRKQWTELNA